jgi:gamma-glutamylcysteine synthetase
LVPSLAALLSELGPQSARPLRDCRPVACVGRHLRGDEIAKAFAGDNEGGFLDPLRDVVATGMTPADRLLARYHGEWNGDVSKIYEEFSF